MAPGAGGGAGQIWGAGPLGGPPIEMAKALGASPGVLPMPDMYQALDKGVFDGAAVPGGRGSWGGWNPPCPRGYRCWRRCRKW